MNPSRCCTLALTLLALAGALAGQTQFGSNAAHTGVVSSKGPRDLKNVKWTFQAGGALISSPALDAATVYVGSDDQHLYAIDRTTGTEKWKFKSEGHLRSSPAVEGDVVYFGSYDGNFYALDASSGKLRWKFATDGERRFEAPGLHGMKPAKQTIPDFWDVYLSSPTLDAENVYFGSGDSHVYALNRATGELRWKFATGGVVHASPALANSVVFIGSWDTYLYALDAKTGAEKWRFKTGEDKKVYNQTGLQSSPTVLDGVVYFGCRDAQLYAVDAETGKQRWAFSIKPTWINATPALHGGFAYVGSSIPTKFYAVDLKSGQEVYSFETDFIVFSSPTVADGHAYFGSFGGKLFSVDLAEKKIRATFQTAGRKENRLGIFDAEGKLHFEKLGGSDFFEDSYRMGEKLFSLGSILATPAVSDGVLYVGDTNGVLYAIE